MPATFERAQRRPGAVDVVGAPAPEPGAVRLLLAQEIVEPARERGRSSLIGPSCASSRDAARRDIGGRRIEQRAMIGEGNVVEIVVVVVGVEGAPAAVAALHAGDPFGGARDRHAIAPRGRNGRAPSPTTAVSSRSG